MVSKTLFSHKSDEWSTPLDLFEYLDSYFHFTLDPCSSFDNHLTPFYFTKFENGLSQDWSGRVAFVNPPYSNIYEWVKKCNFEFRCHGVRSVMLVPVRTDTRWFHDFINDEYMVHFIRGRLRFSGKGSAPFPSMLVFFTPYVDFEFFHYRMERRF